MYESFWYAVAGIGIGFLLGVGLVFLGVMNVSQRDTEDDDMHHTDLKKATAGDVLMGEHRHPMREVDLGQPAPAISIEAYEDAMSGYNIEIKTENFVFTPEHVNTEPFFNEGHAHLFVNGKKITRVYSPWVHLSAKHLQEGSNVVEVTLNANDHSEWANEGEHIQSSLILEKK